jgi:hypothetical protein
MLTMAWRPRASIKRMFARSVHAECLLPGFHKDDFPRREVRRVRQSPRRPASYVLLMSSEVKSFFSVSISMGFLCGNNTSVFC